MFNGCVTFDAFWAYKPDAPFERLPEPWAPAARWCDRCWLLIPNGERGYMQYGGGMRCQPCHRRFPE